MTEVADSPSTAPKMSDHNPAKPLTAELLAHDAIEVIQDCRNLLGIEQGVRLTDVVRSLAKLCEIIDKASSTSVASGYEDFIGIRGDYWGDIEQAASDTRALVSGELATYDPRTQFVVEREVLQNIESSADSITNLVSRKAFPAVRNHAEYIRNKVRGWLASPIQPEETK